MEGERKEENTNMNKHRKCGSGNQNKVSRTQIPAPQEEQLSEISTLTSGGTLVAHKSQGVHVTWNIQGKGTWSLVRSEKKLSCNRWGLGKVIFNVLSKSEMIHILIYTTLVYLGTRTRPSHNLGWADSFSFFFFFSKFLLLSFSISIIFFNIPFPLCINFPFPLSLTNMFTIITVSKARKKMNLINSLVFRARDST